MSKPTLHLDFCSVKAARYAVMRWHYSRAMPTSKVVYIGVWEDDQFIGVIIFGRGAAPAFHKRYGLKITETAELVRVALHRHQHPVSRILSIAIRLLLKSSPGLRLLYSFADPDQGHYGGIYQATNWIYTGTTDASPRIYYGSRWRHPVAIYRAVEAGKLSKKHGLPEKIVPGKHRYLYPLDKKMKHQIEPLRRPYPKPVERS